MKRLCILFAIICICLLGRDLCTANFAGVMEALAADPILPLPTSQLLIPTRGPVVSPILNIDPAQAMPIAVGSVASEGNMVSIQLQTYQFDGPADVYFAISAPPIDPVNIYILTPTGMKTIASAGIVPFMTNILTLNMIFDGIPISWLPPGTYTLFLAVSPSGSLSSFDLWTTNFAVDGTSGVVYIQPSNGGGLLQSSRNGTDYDQYVWDDFTLSSDRTITKIAWRGGYNPGMLGSGGPVIDFTVSIYASIPGGLQPDVVNPPLVEYHTGGNAGQTPAGTFGGINMYDYSFILPAPFQATAGTKYWVQIEASQNGIPDWGIVSGTGGDGIYFRRVAYVSDIFYQLVPGDAAFALQ